MQRIAGLKKEKTAAFLKKLDSALLAFSGGVDSVLLLNLMKEAGMKKFAAATCVSESLPESFLKTAEKHAERVKAEHIVLKSDELSDELFTENTPLRCYYCKKNIFGKLKKLSSDRGFSYILDGASASDTEDYRPGIRAAREMGVISPLIKFNWSKGDIREVSRKMKIPGWDRPATVCLSSRIPYGVPIKRKNLEMIEKSEKFLREKGFSKVRVRSDGVAARIEVEEEELAGLIQIKEEVTRELRKTGFKFISADLEGFESGKMNRTIEDG